MRTGIFVVFVGGAVVTLSAGACKEDDCATTATCAGPPSGGAADGGDTTTEDSGGVRVYPDVEPPRDCSPEGDPKDQPTCVDDAYALFVDGLNGSNTVSDGSRGRPFRTIAAATNIDHLAGRQRIYVCATASPYSEEVTLPPNVSLIGGFTCGTWAYSAAEPATIAPTTPGPAIRLVPSKRLVLMTDLIVRSGDGVDGKESTIGIFVSGATAILRRDTISTGVPKKPNEWSALPTNIPTSSLNGINASGVMPAPEKICQCAIRGSSIGGAGGAPGQQGGSGSAVPDPAPETKNGGPGGVSCTNGDDGLPGLAGAGGAGFTVSGTLDPTLGWVSPPSPQAGSGGAGKGGGGGGGKDTTPGGTTQQGGAGGGCGGCGGAGGRGGVAGGSSFALAAIDADVSIYDSSLTAVTGAGGATGEVGEDGVGGGLPGNQGSCFGGTGGPGAGGGGGAGGSSGISAAIVQLRGRVVADISAILTNGKNGLAGRGESGGVGNGTAPKGEAGGAGFQPPLESPAIVMLP